MTVRSPDAAWAFDRYEALRASLPTASFPPISRRVACLGDIAADFDVFLLDAFGVLNVGEGAIAGAARAVAGLQALGKRVLVLTNGATFPPDAALAKYRGFGLDLAAQDVVASRDALARGMEDAGACLWGVAATPESRIDLLLGRCVLLQDDPDIYERVDAFVLLSSAEWGAGRQRMLTRALTRRPRPLLVGNPDLVAPREGGLTLEPGHWAFEARVGGGVAPVFYGKPFGNIYDLAFERLGDVARDRVLAVGDTLHTDVLGGAAAGVKTALVTDHGLFRGLDVAPFIARSGIRPDFILPSI